MSRHFKEAHLGAILSSERAQKHSRVILLLSSCVGVCLATGAHIAVELELEYEYKHLCIIAMPVPLPALPHLPIIAVTCDVFQST